MNIEFSNFIKRKYMINANYMIKKILVTAFVIKIFVVCPAAGNTISRVRCWDEI